jgi:hypothetical protein
MPMCAVVYLDAIFTSFHILSPKAFPEFILGVIGG